MIVNREAQMTRHDNDFGEGTAPRLFSDKYFARFYLGELGSSELNGIGDRSSTR